MGNIAPGILKERSVAIESAYDTTQALAAGDGTKIMDDGLSIQPDRAQEELQESVGTGSLQGIRLGGRSGQWSATVALSTRGATAPGSAPNWSDFAAAAFGVETINVDTSVVYTLSDTVLQSLAIRERVSTYLYQAAHGCWVESMELDFTQNAIPKLSFSGGFATYAWCYNPTVGANANAAATSVEVTAAHYGGISEGVIVKFGTEDNSGSGYTVTAVDWSAGTIAISPGLANGISQNDAIVPIWPTNTYVSAVPVAGTQQALTINGVTLPVASAKITLATGIHGLDKTSDRPERLSHGQRRVTFDFQCYYEDQVTAPPLGLALGQATNGDTVVGRDIDLRIGADTAGVRAKFSIPNGVCNVNEISVPGSEETMINITGTALQNSAALDELVLTLD